jgi:plastocyanin
MHSVVRASQESTMSTQQIQIQRNTTPTPSQPAKFVPAAVTAYAGDDLTWFNGDGEAHWPTPNAATKRAWFRTEISPGETSDGQVALGPNQVIVIKATNANPVVFTVQGPAPATGAMVTLFFAAPGGSPDSPWKDAIKSLAMPTSATNLGPNRCSIPALDSTALGPLGNGQITVSMPGAYTINYVCALHPAETGIITVNPQR